ncbi:hypothetical protein RI367_000895 [Sorochytrium milnesiophthora]
MIPSPSRVLLTLLLLAATGTADLCLRYPTASRLKLCQSAAANLAPPTTVRCAPFVDACSALQVDSFSKISAYLEQPDANSTKVAARLAKALQQSSTDPDDEATTALAVQAVLHANRYAPVLSLEPDIVPDAVRHDVMAYISGNADLAALEQEQQQLRMGMVKCMVATIAQTFACYDRRERRLCDMLTLQRFHQLVDLFVVYVDMNHDALVHAATAEARAHRGGSGSGSDSESKGDEITAAEADADAQQLDRGRLALLAPFLASLRRVGPPGGKLARADAALKVADHPSVFSPDMVARLVMLDILSGALTDALANATTLSVTTDSQGAAVSTIAQFVLLPMFFPDQAVVTEQETLQAAVQALHRVRDLGAAILQYKADHAFMFGMVASGFEMLLRPVVAALIAVDPVHLAESGSKEEL